MADLDSPATARTKDFDRKLGLGEMKKAFVAYESSQAIVDRETAREAVRRAESLLLGEQLIADPVPLLDRLTATNATFTLRAIEKIVDEKVRDREQRDELIAKIVQQGVELRDQRGKTRFTTHAVRKAETTAREAATGLPAAAATS